MSNLLQSPVIGKVAQRERGGGGMEERKEGVYLSLCNGLRMKWSYVFVAVSFSQLLSETQKKIHYILYGCLTHSQFFTSTYVSTINIYSTFLSLATYQPSKHKTVYSTAKQARRKQIWTGQARKWVW